MLKKIVEITEQSGQLEKGGDLPNPQLPVTNSKEMEELSSINAEESKTKDLVLSTEEEAIMSTGEKTETGDDPNKDELTPSEENK